MSELSLDEMVRHVARGAAYRVLAREQGFEALYVPETDAPEAALVEGIDVYLRESLGPLAANLRDYYPIEL